MKYIRVTLSGGNDKKNMDQYKAFEFDIEEVKKRCTIANSEDMKIELLHHIMIDFMLKIECEMLEMMNQSSMVSKPLKQKGVISKT